MRAVVLVGHAALFVVSIVLFGVVGLALNLACAPFLLLPGRARFAPAARRAIRRLFDLWVRWFGLTRGIVIEWCHWPPPESLRGGAVYVANHPSLLDATVLLARLPDAICIFKPALLRNPFVAPAALLAGYCAGDRGLDTVRDAAAAVAAGCSLLIFPEGTRTRPGTVLNPLRPGFALIARRAGVPVRVIAITASPDLFPKGYRWWPPPKIPAQFRATFIAELNPADFAGTTELAAAVEQLWRPGRGPTAIPDAASR
jgi:1-acyl-sn-glycerol-3-phosphate acyltransferase